jgi:hypothetical protein
MKPVSLFSTPLYSFPFKRVVYTRTGKHIQAKSPVTGRWDVTDPPTLVFCLEVYIEGKAEPILLFEDNVKRFHLEYATWCEVTS